MTQSNQFANYSCFPLVAAVSLIDYNYIWAKQWAYTSYLYGAVTALALYPDESVLAVAITHFV